MMQPVRRGSPEPRTKTPEPIFCRMCDRELDPRWYEAGDLCDACYEDGYDPWAGGMADE